MSRIWLNGKSTNQVYLYDTDTGSGRGFPRHSYRGATAGDLSRLSGKDVATYVDPTGRTVWLQIDRERYPLDERTQAREARTLGGLLAKVTVSSVGHPTVTLTQRRPGRQVHAIAHLIGSSRARETFRTVKEPTAGPDVAGSTGRRAVFSSRADQNRPADPPAAARAPELSELRPGA